MCIWQSIYLNILCNTWWSLLSCQGSYWCCEFLLDTQKVPLILFWKITPWHFLIRAELQSWHLTEIKASFIWQIGSTTYSVPPAHLLCPPQYPHRHIKIWWCVRQEALTADTPPVPIHFIWFRKWWRLCHFYSYALLCCEVFSDVSLRLWPCH